jgi:hypothetical protein
VDAHTPEEKILVKMLEAVAVRTVIDWTLDKDGLPVYQAIWNTTGRRAALGQELGATVHPPCSRCADSEKKLAWGSCKVVLLETGHFVSSGACMNCLWATEAHRCSFRAERSSAHGALEQQFKTENPRAWENLQQRLSHKKAKASKSVPTDTVDSPTAVTPTAVTPHKGKPLLGHPLAPESVHPSLQMPDPFTQAPSYTIYESSTPVSRVALRRDLSPAPSVLSHAGFSVRTVYQSPRSRKGVFNSPSMLEESLEVLYAVQDQVARDIAAFKKRLGSLKPRELTDEELFAKMEQEEGE